MSTFYAQPYDISGNGFFFESAEEWTDLSAKAINRYGFPVEEFEIQFIDGEMIDAALAEALDVHQGNITYFFEREAEWDEHRKRVAIIAARECGYALDLECCDPDRFDVDIYELDTMRALAEQFVDEGLFGDIPEHLANYIDYDAIARDLAMDYGQTCIAGTRLIYRCC
tara:strand:- start:201 stop:707 length:507 start_codon:yes stop_codon:yes gene_type:complete